MYKLKHNILFKLIAVILVNAFFCLDIAWAAGGDIKSLNTHLAPALEISSPDLLGYFTRIYEPDPVPGFKNNIKRLRAVLSNLAIAKGDLDRIKGTNYKNEVIYDVSLSALHPILERLKRIEVMVHEHSELLYGDLNRIHIELSSVYNYVESLLDAVGNPGNRSRKVRFPGLNHFREEQDKISVKRVEFAISMLEQAIALLQEKISWTQYLANANRIKSVEDSLVAAYIAGLFHRILPEKVLVSDKLPITPKHQFWTSVAAFLMSGAVGGYSVLTGFWPVFATNMFAGILAGAFLTVFILIPLVSAIISGIAIITGFNPLAEFDPNTNRIINNTDEYIEKVQKRLKRSSLPFYLQTIISISATIAIKISYWFVLPHELSHLVLKTENEVKADIEILFAYGSLLVLSIVVLFSEWGPVMLKVIASCDWTEYLVLLMIFLCVNVLLSINSTWKLWSFIFNRLLLKPYFRNFWSFTKEIQNRGLKEGMSIVDLTIRYILRESSQLLKKQGVENIRIFRHCALFIVSILALSLLLPGASLYDQSLNFGLLWCIAFLAAFFKACLVPIEDWIEQIPSIDSYFRAVMIADSLRLDKEFPQDISPGAKMAIKLGAVVRILEQLEEGKKVTDILENKDALRQRIKKEVVELILNREERSRDLQPVGRKVYPQFPFSMSKNKMYRLLGFDVRNRGTVLEREHIIVPPSRAADTLSYILVHLRQLGLLGEEGEYYTDMMTVQGRLPDEAKHIAIALLATSPYAHDDWKEGPFETTWGKSAPLVHGGGVVEHIHGAPQLEGRTDYLNRHAIVYMQYLEQFIKMQFQGIYLEEEQLNKAEEEFKETGRLFFESRAWQRLCWALASKEGMIESNDKTQQAAIVWDYFQNSLREIFRKHNLESALDVRWFLKESRSLGGWPDRYEADWEPIKPTLILLEQERQKNPVFIGEVRALLDETVVALGEIIDGVDYRDSKGKTQQLLEEVLLLTMPKESLYNDTLFSTEVLDAMQVSRLEEVERAI
ncbi:MAG: hypothetical protein ABH952_04570 [Candidatus Omnitrophota bacterium]